MNIEIFKKARGCDVLSALALILWIFVGPCALAADTGPMAPGYWMSGEDPVTIKDKNRSDPADYLGLFLPGCAMVILRRQVKGVQNQYAVGDAWHGRATEDRD